MTKKTEEKRQRRRQRIIPGPPTLCCFFFFGGGRKKRGEISEGGKDLSSAPRPLLFLKGGKEQRQRSVKAAESCPPAPRSLNSFLEKERGKWTAHRRCINYVYIYSSLQLSCPFPFPSLIAVKLLFSLLLEKGKRLLDCKKLDMYT